MGFSHHLYQQRGPIAPKTWAKITFDAARLLTVSPHPLHIEDIGPERIMFNGIPGYETCLVKRTQPRGFSFTKTNWQPYDLVVCAVYAVCAMHAPFEVQVHSDGDESHWAGPLQWASQVLGKPVPMPVFRVEPIE